MLCHFISICMLLYPNIDHEKSDTTHDSIVNVKSLYSFFEDLALISEANQIVSILHIGDSHIQADYFTGKLRKNFQNQFGNSGRGLVFPYTIANSNGSSDVKFDHQGDWNLLSKRKKNNQAKTGILGYTLWPGSNAKFSIQVDYNGPSKFSKIILWDTFGTFLPFNNKSIVTWERKSGYTEISSTSPLHQIDFKSTHSSGDQPTLNGIVLQNDSVGILYHAAGINGATVAQYLLSDFSQNIIDLNPNLLIISLGTNDCYTTINQFCASCVKENYRILIRRIRINNPTLPILLSTPPDHFYKRKYDNVNIESLRKVLHELVYEENVALWDLFQIMGGSNSILDWQKQGLAAKDLIHFSVKGYEKQGDLLYQTLMKYYPLE